MALDNTEQIAHANIIDQLKTTKNALDTLVQYSTQLPLDQWRNNAEISSDLALFLRLVSGFVHQVCAGNVNSINEVCTAIECKLYHPEGGSTGADAIHPETLKTVEIKDSQLHKKKGDKQWSSSWNFRMPAGFDKTTEETVAQARHRLRLKLAELLQSAIIFSALQNEKVVVRYEIDAAWFVHLLAVKMIDASGKSHYAVNVGSQQCTKCNHFHRLCYYRLLSQKKSPSSIDEQEWERIAAHSIPSQKQCEQFMKEYQ